MPNPNIVLIVIDALRARELGCYGSKAGLSPNIDRLAETGFLFEDAYCCWNTTDPSLTSILTGKYPISHGITQHGDKIREEHLRIFRDTGTRTLAEFLNERGYRTMAVDWMGRWFRRGFDRYGYEMQRDLPGKIKYALVDSPAQYLRYILAHYHIFRCYGERQKSTFRQFILDAKGVLQTFWFTKELARLQDASFLTDVAESWVRDASDRPFFLFLHYWDTHTPYHCAGSDLRYRGGDPREVLEDRYRGSIRYVDRQLGRLFAGLLRQGLWENTLVIVTSDHGESLTEHGILFDHHGLYDVTTHVPLVMNYPRMPAPPARIKGFVQHVDLLPTVLELLGADPYSEGFDGKSLVGPIQRMASDARPFVVTEESYVQRKRALRNARYKYISAPEGEDGGCRYCHKVHVGREELYDLTTDPGEERDLVETHPLVAREMRDMLEGWVRERIQARDGRIERLSSMESGTPVGDDWSPDEADEISRKLRALGYH